MPVPSLPTLPSFSLSTGPQVTSGQSGGTFSPNFGGGFFDRAGAPGGGLSLTAALLLTAAAGVAAWAWSTGKVKF